MRIIPPGWQEPYPDGAIVRGFPVRWVEHVPEPAPMRPPRYATVWRGPDRLEAIADGEVLTYVRSEAGFREV